MSTRRVMRISELSRTTGVPVATIKYYLREGLLQAGTLTARNQAEYGDAHVHRLRLIRALREIGGLGIARVRDVVRAIEDDSLPLHQLLGVAHYALAQPAASAGPEAPDVQRARVEVDRFIDGLNWKVSPNAPGRGTLAGALAALRRLGRDADADVFAPYADAADAIAAHEIDTIPRASDRGETVEGLVVGTVVFEAALTALRRLAQEHHSSLRLGGTPASGRSGSGSARRSTRADRRAGAGLARIGQRVGSSRKRHKVSTSSRSPTT